MRTSLEGSVATPPMLVAMAVLVLWVGPAAATLTAQGTPGAPPAAQTVVPNPDQFEATAPTDDPELEAQVQKLAKQLRCPTCQALSIADSPSELAREMEGVIRARLQDGMTPEEVRASFVDAYGEWVLLSPNPSGFNLLVYALPIAVLLLGSGIVVVGMRRWLNAPSPDAEVEEPAQPVS
jgi:cytochrome c-type biogenesis protein CcmH